MNHVKHIVIITLMALMTACGGGGGGGESSVNGGTGSTAKTTVSGVASKGIIVGGTVKVFPVNAAGVKGSIALAVGTTDTNGAYSIDLGAYSGQVVVEVSGTYRDEATDVDIAVPSSAPLHAALAGVVAGKPFSLPVTPLTEMAYRSISGPLTASNIRNANDMISYIMRLDIINTKPVAPTVTAFAAATQSQRDYSLLLAAVSQLMKTQGMTLDATLTYLNNGLTSTSTATALNASLAAFLANPNNHTGVTTLPGSLQNTGTIGKKVTLAISGGNVNSVQAIGVTLTLPAELLLRTDTAGVPLPAVFRLSSSAATIQNIMYTARYVAASGSTPATIALAVLAPNGGFSVGDVITITCDTAVNATAPATSTITLSGIDFRDQNGAVLTAAERPSLRLI